MTRAALLFLLAAMVPVAGSASARTAEPELVDRGRVLARAKLVLVDRDPVVVRATGFKPLERTRVTAYTHDGPRVRRVVATRLGRFAARFDGLSFESCSSAITLIRAVGRKGTVAALRFTLRECAAP